jgi:F-box/leucine-rich repeat protein 2/20
MGGIGGEVREEGLIRLFKTTPWIRKIDLEDAADVGDALIEVLTPDPSSSDAVSPVLADGPAPQPGHALEDLIISHAIGVNNDALLALVRRCARLRVLEADGTRILPGTVKEFVKLSRERGMRDARLVAIDCRSVGDGATKEIFSFIRPRMGWRAYGARKLGYLDSRDDEYADIAAEVGGSDGGRRNAESVVMDECDPERVVVKTFYTWQVVDQVKAAREKRTKAGKAAGKGGIGGTDVGRFGCWWCGGGGGGGGGGARMRWWPGAWEVGGVRGSRVLGPRRYLRLDRIGRGASSCKDFEPGWNHRSDRNIPRLRLRLRLRSRSRPSVGFSHTRGHGLGVLFFLVSLPFLVLWS